MADFMEALAPIAILGSVAGAFSGKKRRGSSSGGLLSLLLNSQLQEDQARMQMKARQDEQNRQLYNALAGNAVSEGLSFKDFDPSQPITSEMIDAMAKGKRNKLLSALLENYSPYAKDQPVLGNANTWEDIRNVMDSPEFRDIARRRLTGESTLKAMETGQGLSAAGASGKGLMQMLFEGLPGVAYDELSKGDVKARDKALARQQSLENTRHTNDVQSKILSSLLNGGGGGGAPSATKPKTTPEGVIFKEIQETANKLIREKLKLVEVDFIGLESDEIAKQTEKLRQEAIKESMEMVIPMYDVNSYDGDKLKSILSNNLGINFNSNATKTQPEETKGEGKLSAPDENGVMHWNG